MPYPQWGRINQIQAVGWQDYRALLMRLEKRLSNNHQYTVSYTLATVRWTTRSAGRRPGNINNVYRPELDEGYGIADRRHGARGERRGGAAVRHHVGRVWTLRTGRPFTASAGVDLDGNRNNDYVPGTKKGDGNRMDMGEFLGLVNAFRATPQSRRRFAESQIDSDKYKRIDLRVSKAVQLRRQPRRADRPGVQPVRHDQSRRHRVHAPDQRAVQRLRSDPGRPAASGRRARDQVDLVRGEQKHLYRLTYVTLLMSRAREHRDAEVLWPVSVEGEIMRIAVAIFALSLGVPVHAQEAPLSAAECTRLAASLKLPNTTVTAAQPVAAGQFKAPGGGAAQAMATLPAFCRVSLTIKPSSDSDIKSEVWLPMAGWNGKFLAVGNGAWGGSIQYGALGDGAAARLRRCVDRHRPYRHRRQLRGRSSREAD